MDNDVMHFEFDDRASTEEASRYVRVNFRDKLRQVAGLGKLADHLWALYHYMTDPSVHWSKKAVVVSALVYFIVPTDAMPDFVPIAGFLDDIGVISLTVRYVGKQLRPYYLGGVGITTQTD